MLTFLLLTVAFGREFVVILMSPGGIGQSLVGYGLQFITAFPENVGFLQPFNAQNSLNFTALYSDTEVNVYYKGSLIHSTTLQDDQTENYILPADVEVSELTQALKSVRIVSSKHIVVTSITEQGDSVQSSVLQPYQNLGTYYSVPYLNYTEMLITFSQPAETTSKKYSSFRLMVINTQGVNNNITILGYNIINNVYYTAYQRFVLRPYALLQLPLNGSELAVYSIYKVAVLMSHPCFKATNCKCNMVMKQLHSISQGGLRFIVPLLNNNQYLHMKKYYGETTQSSLEPVRSTHVVNTNITSFFTLISPGLMINAIPENMFSACYQVHSMMDGRVLVIAQTVSTSQVHIDNDPMVSDGWTAVPGTNYSTASVSLSGRHLIWHPASKIGVYMLYRMASGTLYGGPAVSLSDQPDPNGCFFLPPEFTVGPTLMSWTESLEFCLSINAELIGPTTAKAYGMLSSVLKKLAKQQYWIGLRRQLLTLEWFWYKGEELVELNYTQWSAGEPGDPGMGMCVSVMPNMTWNALPCCTPLTPICYTPPS